MPTFTGSPAYRKERTSKPNKRRTACVRFGEFAHAEQESSAGDLHEPYVSAGVCQMCASGEVDLVHQFVNGYEPYCLIPIGSL